MKAFFQPASVCVIGASAEAQRIGGRPVHYLNQAGYAGRIYPVNPNRDEIQGHRAYPSLQALPETPELVVIALPGAQVPAAVRECAARGVPAITIFAAGFAETGEAGRALQASLVDAVRGTGTRLLGPNANGTMAPGARLYACFTPLLQRGLPVPGGVAILTQSAALGTYLLDQCRERGIGVACWAHTGNEADVDLLDAVAFAVEDDGVRMAMITSEVLRAPRRLRATLARAAERDVLVAVLQVGRSAIGERAAASHTGALVEAQSRVTRGLLRQGGAVLTRSMRELVDIAEAHSRFGRIPGARVGILTPSGGIGIMLADALEGSGVVLPPLSDALQARLRAAAPFCHPGNPVDITAQIINEPQRFEAVLAAMAESGELDLVLAFLPVGGADDPLTRALVAVATRLRDAGSALRFGVVGTLDPDAFALLAATGIARWREPDDLAAALAAVAGRRRAQLALEAPAVATSAALRARIAAAATAGIVGEYDAKSLLRERGLAVIADVAVTTPAAAADAADTLGYPVALKLAAAGLAHKARVGGVRLDLRTRADVAAAAQAMLAATGGPAGLLVEPMVTGQECFVGVIDAPDHGPLALFGLGGGDVEARACIAYRYLPLAPGEVGDMQQELGIAAFFGDAARASRVAGQVEAMVAQLARILAEAGGAIRAIELNPVMFDARGAATVVDALIDVADAATPATMEQA